MPKCLPSSSNLAELELQALFLLQWAETEFLFNSQFSSCILLSHLGILPDSVQFRSQPRNWKEFICGFGDLHPYDFPLTGDFSFSVSSIIGSLKLYFPLPQANKTMDFFWSSICPMICQLGSFLNYINMDLLWCGPLISRVGSFPVSASFW